jgi:hypothetical protein
MYYNFVRIHQALRITPAMAAGVTSSPMEIADMVDILEAWEVRQREAERAEAEKNQYSSGPALGHRS